MFVSLPSLAVFGRCCLRWAAWLQHEMPIVFAPGPPPEGLTLGRHTAVGTLTRNIAAQPGCLPASAECISSWLGQRGQRLELSSAGCDVTQLRQQLQRLLRSLKAATATVIHSQADSESVLEGLAEQLQATGTLLAAVCVSVGCNNPGCRNMDGCLEADLVSGEKTGETNRASAQAAY